MNRDELILKWQEATKALALAKEVELSLRNAVIQANFSAEMSPTGLNEGTHNIELGNGYRLKAVGKLNYNVSTEAAEKALDAIAKSGPEGKFVAARLVTWSPRLSLTEWRNLPDKLRKVFSPALTITPATPTLEIVEPKAKK